MTKLLSAEYARLFHSFVFKLAMMVSGGLAALSVFTLWRDVRMFPEAYATLDIKYSMVDRLIFTGGIYLTFAFAVFIGIFVGTEYSDGTIRNKLTVGHTRGSIYFSKLIVCITADLMIHLLYIIAVLVLGYLLLGGTTLTPAKILGNTAISMVCVLAITSLLLLFSMSIQSKATGSVVLILSILFLLIATSTISNRLNEPEYYDSYELGSSGAVQAGEEEKNPLYLTGKKREMYQFLYDFIPIAQLYQISMGDNIQHPQLILACDCFILIFTTGAGMFIFQRKNLK